LAIKEGDFVNIDYVGEVDGKIFDLTDEKLAKEKGLYEENKKYGPVTIVVGAGHVIKGLDESLIGKNVGDEYEVDVPPEKGFGKKNPKLLKIIPERVFKEQKLTPHAGMAVTVNGLLGYIISVSGGRVIVDFNHPLASRTLHYKVKINKLIDDKKEQLFALVNVYAGFTEEDFDIELKDSKAEIKLKKDLNDKVKEVIIKDAKKYINLDVEFK